MQPLRTLTVMAVLWTSPAAAEIGCQGHLIPSNGSFFKAQVRCTNTEPANQGYKCSGTWRLTGEDDKEYLFLDPVTTVAKGAVDFLKYENDRVGEGMQIKGQAHPYEGKCEL